jgi:hypothetical protein
MLTVPVGDWSSKVRPTMDQRSLGWYTQSKELLKENKTAEAIALWKNLISSENLKNARTWLYLTLGEDLEGVWEIMRLRVSAP